MINGRELKRHEIKRIWAIDRREVIDAVYYLEDGALVLKPEYWNMQGWPPGEEEQYTPILDEAFDAGGWFYGVFEGPALVGVAVLDGRPIGRHADALQLKLLHVGRLHRDQGLGRQLFDLAAAEARQRGARRLYISATPSEHTINFYLRLGCTVTSEPDPALFALEPEDIHLEYALAPDR